MSLLPPDRLKEIVQLAKRHVSESTRADQRDEAIVQLSTELEVLKDALVEINGCFDAAICEGLMDRINDAADFDNQTGSLADLLVRRVMFAHTVAIRAPPPAPKEEGV